MNIRNVTIGFFIFITINFSTQYAQIKMSIQEQDRIRQFLYNSETDFSSFNCEMIPTYVQVIKNHVVVLENMIDKQSSFFNNADGILGMLEGLAGFYGLLYSSWCVLKFYNLYASPNNYVGKQKIFYEFKCIKNFFLEQPIYAVRYIVPLILFKFAYDDLSKAWHAKENAMKELAKDKGLLFKLEKMELQS